MTGQTELDLGLPQLAPRPDSRYQPALCAACTVAMSRPRTPGPWPCPHCGHHLEDHPA